MIVLIAKLFARRNAGRDLAMIRVHNDRARIHAVARAMREAKGLPPVKVLGA